MPHRAAPDVRLGKLLHPDRRHHPRIDPLLLEDVLKGERVDHSRQHPHVVRGDPVHPLLARRRAPHDVPPTDDEAELHAHRRDRFQLVRQPLDDAEVDPAGAPGTAAGEGFSGNLQERAPVGQLRRRRGGGSSGGG